MTTDRVIRGRAVLCALALLLGCSGGSKQEPSTEAANPAEPAKAALGAGAKPGATDAPAAAKPAEPEPPGKQPKPHDPNRTLPPPPDGMIWISGTVNGAPGGTIARSVTDVCIFERDDLPCAETDMAAVFSIAAPKNAPIALLFKGPKLTPTLRPFVTGKENMNIGNTRVANEAGVMRVAKALDQEERPDRGVIFFAGVTGTTATLEPASGTRFFLSYGSKLDPDARGVPLRGTAGFFNVMPGKTAIRFQHADGPCRFRTDNPMSGWPDPADPGVAIVPVLPGHHVHLTTMYCGKDHTPPGVPIPSPKMKAAAAKAKAEAEAAAKGGTKPEPPKAKAPAAAKPAAKADATKAKPPGGDGAK